MKFNSKANVELFTNIMSEGLIVIDNEGIIQIYNNKAKEIFGIRYEQEINHSGGKINTGDIVIIADNDLGKDDGNLDSQSFEILGIKNKDIEKGDSLIAIGPYGINNKIKPVYKFLKKGHKEEQLRLEANILDLDIEVEIDFQEGEISIKVEEQEFNMKYINAIGHMVIINGETREMKFYQSNGYTARGESIKDILGRKEYRAKGKDTEALDVIGKHISEIHKSDLIIDEFSQVARGEDITYKDKYEEINGYPTMCSLLNIEDKGELIGAALKVEDISEIKRLMHERDNVIRELEEAEKKLLEEEILSKSFPKFIGNSKQIEYVKKMALKASNSNSNVLILGESGTGKTILGKAIHENSKNKDKPFMYINCASISDELLELELFGSEKIHSKGEVKKGIFELANGGSILLDEIHNISQDIQVKLLQVIQEKSFYRLDEREKIEIDIRIITASNKNLEEEIDKGSFREDFYYRINVFPIWIPPLRERKEDIESLVDYLLPHICKNMACQQKRISSEALSLILRYSWPGNVRELENILERAVNLSNGRTILSKDILLKFKNNRDINKEVLPLRELLDLKEKLIIEETLAIYDGDKKKTMKALDISKTNLYEKLKKYKI